MRGQNGSLQSKDFLLIGALAVDTEDRFMRMVFVDFDSDYWTPDLLWSHEAEALKKQY